MAWATETKWAAGHRFAGPYSAPGFRPRSGRRCCSGVSRLNFWAAAATSWAPRTRLGSSSSALAPKAAARWRYSKTWWVVRDGSRFDSVDWLVWSTGRGRVELPGAEETSRWISRGDRLRMAALCGRLGTAWV